jgi:hypothetical protein
MKSVEESNKGYHITPIEKGIYGEISKILEEVQELSDAKLQCNEVMILVELADLYGAMEAYLLQHHPSISMQDLQKMSEATKRAFQNGHRN